MTLTIRAFIPSSRSILAGALAIGAIALLAGCEGGLDVNNSTLPLPAIAPGTAAVTCSAAAGGGTITLSAVGTRVTTGYPVDPVNRVDVAGASSGIDPTATIHVVLLPVTVDCPAIQQVSVTPAADGSFAATIDIRNNLRFRLVAFAAPSASLAACPGSDCIDIPGLLATSNTLEVRLN